MILLQADPALVNATTDVAYSFKDNLLGIIALPSVQLLFVTVMVLTGLIIFIGQEVKRSIDSIHYPGTKL
jgi:hypothetical protein